MATYYVMAHDCYYPSSGMDNFKAKVTASSWELADLIAKRDYGSYDYMELWTLEDVKRHLRGLKKLEIAKETSHA